MLDKTATYIGRDTAFIHALTHPTIQEQRRQVCTARRRNGFFYAQKQPRGRSHSLIHAFYNAHMACAGPSSRT